MTSKLPVTMPAKNELKTILFCTTCDVTWREQPGTPCWFCGDTGHVKSPERLVLD